MNKDIIDTDIAEAIAEIEIDLEGSKEGQKIMETTKEHIDELTKQLEAAKQASDAAQAELDNLKLAEAKAVAELEVAKSEKEKTEKEIAEIRPSVEELQEEVKQAKAELKEATAKLNEIKETKEQQQLAAEKARQALQATVSLESKLIAETEAARKNAERYKRQKQKIENRLDDLNVRLQRAKEMAVKSEEELKSARIQEAKLESELSLYQEELPDDYSLSQKQIQTQDDSESGESSQEDKFEPERKIVDDLNEEFSEQEAEENSEKLSTIYNLYDAGYSIDDISKATNIAQGQVELFIKMRSLKLSV